MAVIAKPSARMPTYIGLLRLPVTSLFEMKVPTRRMSSVPVAIRGRSAVIVRYSGTISRMQRLPAFGGCAKPARRGAGADLLPGPHRSVGGDHARGPKPPVLVTKEAKDRLAGAGFSAHRKCRKGPERSRRCWDTDS